jgi:hypothetical protein
MLSVNDWVGRYALVLSPELQEFIERTFVESTTLADRARVRAEALNEARQAELEISAEGWIASRSGALELYRVALPLELFTAPAVRFEKGPGISVELTRLDENRLSARQPGKPLTEFVRR